VNSLDLQILDYIKVRESHTWELVESKDGSTTLVNRCSVCGVYSSSLYNLRSCEEVSMDEALK